MDHQYFVSRIESMDGVSSSADHNTRFAINGFTVDFSIPTLTAFPSTLDDELPNMISKSSVCIENDGRHGIRTHDKRIAGQLDSSADGMDLSADYDPICVSGTIHLPPYRHEHRDAIESAIDCGETFAIRHGTTQMGVVTGPHEWGLTPHVELMNDCSLDRMLRCIRQCAEFVDTHDYCTDAELREMYDG